MHHAGHDAGVCANAYDRYEYQYVTDAAVCVCVAELKSIPLENFLEKKHYSAGISF